MDINYIEFAANVVFRMCREHPEICPHNYRWRWTSAPKDGKREAHYICDLCGKEIIEEED